MAKLGCLGGEFGDGRFRSRPESVEVNVGVGGFGKGREVGVGRKEAGAEDGEVDGHSEQVSLFSKSSGEMLRTRRCNTGYIVR